MSKRTKNFGTIVYPESAPANWQEILEEQFIPALISPLHNQDTTSEGELKKEHYHVVLMYDGVKTLEQAREVTEKIGGVGCEVIQSIKGYTRYLCHIDNPERHQYDPEQVKAFCGADYLAIIGIATDKYKSIGEMIDYCIEYSVYSYAELLEYARLHRFEWFRVLCDNGTVVIKEYLKSRTWTQKTLDREKLPMVE